MPHFAAYFLPVALLFPQPTDGAREGQGEEAIAAAAPEKQDDTNTTPSGWLPFNAPDSAPVQYQVRVEQRVIIRISPQRSSPRTDLTSTLPRGEIPKQMVERKIGKCLPLRGIAGVMPAKDNRLVLFMRDQRIIAANLEKACSAQDYYSGFYVEPRKDGNICVERDKLQSRTGAKCEMRRIRQLVRVDT